MKLLSAVPASFVLQAILLIPAGAQNVAEPERPIDPPPCAIQHSTAVGNTMWLLCDGDGLLLTTDGGSRWQTVRLPSDQKLRSIAFLDGRRGFIAGDRGTLLATADGGLHWAPVAVPVTDPLTSLFFIGDSGWLTGWNGVMLHTADAGRTWTSQSTGTTQSLESVYFATPERGWSVGWAGTILRTSNGGKTWEHVRAGDLIWSLNAVYFADVNNGWAVGFGGQVLRTVDGGATWQSQSVPVKASLTSVSFDSEGRGWIAAGSDLFVSRDRGNKRERSPIPATSSVQTVLDTKSGLRAVGPFDVLHWRDAESRWRLVDLGLARDTSTD